MLRASLKRETKPIAQERGPGGRSHDPTPVHNLRANRGCLETTTIQLDHPRTAGGVVAKPTRSSLVGNQRPEAERRRDRPDQAAAARKGAA